MTNNDWQQIGETFEELVAQGYYPGLGFDEYGWEMWYFLHPPVQGRAGEMKKVSAPTLDETHSLLWKIMERLNV